MRPFCEFCGCDLDPEDIVLVERFGEVRTLCVACAYPGPELVVSGLDPDPEAVREQLGGWQG